MAFDLLSAGIGFVAGGVVGGSAGYLVGKSAGRSEMSATFGTKALSTEETIAMATNAINLEAAKGQIEAKLEMAKKEEAAKKHQATL